jgi:hypothetical protein
MRSSYEAIDYYFNVNGVTQTVIEHYTLPVLKINELEKSIGIITENSRASATQTWAYTERADATR